TLPPYTPGAGFTDWDSKLGLTGWNDKSEGVRLTLLRPPSAAYLSTQQSAIIPMRYRLANFLYSTASPSQLKTVAGYSRRLRSRAVRFALREAADDEIDWLARKF